jgi:hypothetical protein
MAVKLHRHVLGRQISNGTTVAVVDAVRTLPADGAGDRRARGDNVGDDAVIRQRHVGDRQAIFGQQC